MKDLIDNYFYNICFKDIDEILDIMNPIISEIDNVNLDHNYYNSDDKIIVSKPVLDEDNEKIGQLISVLFTNEQSSYTLEYTEEYSKKSLNLEIQSYEDDVFISKQMEVSLEDNIINRGYVYEVNGCVTYYDTSYELCSAIEYAEYLSEESLSETLEQQRPKNLRDRQRRNI